MADKPDPKLAAGANRDLQTAAFPEQQGSAPPPPSPPVANSDDGEDLTYLPGPQDPPSITWRGQVFRANVPKRIVDAEHLDAARGNKFFRVGKSDPNDPDHNPNDDPPATAMEYKAHVVAWLKTCDTVESVVKHWADDRQLRQACDVGEDDIKWLGTLAGPKLMEFKRREGMNDQNVAAMWVKYGFTEIPWRG
jgi:hypothetical protein